MIKKIQNFLHARSSRNSRVPKSVRAISFILSVVLTTGGIGYAVAFAANTVIGNNILTSGTLTVGGTTTFNALTYTWPSIAGSAGQILSNDGAGNLSWAASGGGGSLFTDGGATSYLTSTDNLGVGTTSTAFKLGVQGNGLFSGNLSAANMVATGTLKIISLGASTPAEIYLNPNGTQVALLGAHSDNSFDIFMNGLTPPAFYIGPGSSGGYIGMATNTPSQRLSVQGSALFSGDITSIANITATGTLTIGHSATTSAKLFVADGVATGTPGIPGTTQNLAWFAGNGGYPTIGVENTSNGVRMGMVGFTDGDGAHGLLSTLSNHPLAFEVNAGGGGSPAMWISTANKIGIGTTTPNEVLSVIGNIAMSGSLLPTVAPAVTAQSSQPQASSTIDGAGFDAVPNGHSIVLGADGFPVIAYRNATNSSLKVTKCGDANCYTATTTSTVIGAGLVGGGDQSISIAIGADGFPVITYGKATENSLHLVKCANASCSATTSDLFIDGVVGGTAPNVGTSTSIAFTNDGNPKISYYDATNGELRFASCNNPACSSVATSTLDGIGARDAGAFNSMTVLPDDSLVISYYDVTNGDLNVAKCKGPTCGGGVATTSPDSTGDVGKYTSVAIATDGMPIISYYDITNLDLKVAKCTDLSCITSPTLLTLDSTGDVGQYSSLAIGSDGFPIISYYDLTNTALKTVKCSNSTCSTINSAYKTSLDTDNVGKYSSLIIGTDGMPVIAYYASADTNVRLFKCNGQNCAGLGTGLLMRGSDLGSLGKFFNNAYVESLWAKQIAIKRFDLAEDYYSHDVLNAGEIVSLDPSEPLHMHRATLNGGARIIGIVSTEPAMVLSDFTMPASNDKNYPIALAGRVPVKVNNEGGAIAIGDPITLSSVSGVGKRASGDEEKNIGYALDAFSGVSGTIRVFVNLNGENNSIDNDSSGLFIGQVIGVVKNWLESIKIYVEDGLVRIKDLAAEKITALGVNTINLKVGTGEAPSGITLFDKITNLPYCVMVSGGQLQTAPGECVSQAVSSSVATTTIPVATTTVPLLDIVAPVITLNGSAKIEILKGTAWSDPGATVVDPAYGSLAGQAIPANTNLSIHYKVDGVETANGGREVPTVNTAQNGLHVITYTATDSSGNVGTASRAVTVIDPAASTTQTTVATSTPAA